MTRYAVLLALVLAAAGCYTSSTTPPPAAVAEGPPPKKPKQRAARSGSCDEVSCVLSNYEGACCARMKPPASARQTHLDRHHIQQAIAGVRPHITACAGTGIKGTVKVSVRVAPDGGIASATIMSSIDPAVDACVLAAIGLAVFPPTDAGGSFAYPFVF